MANWHTADSARMQWADAPTSDELSDLLNMAADACWKFNHEGEEPPTDEIPVRYRIAQLMQAKAAWQLTRTSPNNDSMNIEGYQARVYVFGKDVQRILVPPVFGEVVG